jgi:hypothetical protein
VKAGEVLPQALIPDHEKLALKAEAVGDQVALGSARAALPSLSKSETRLGEWLRTLLARMHKNAAVVALANKLARIAWAVGRAAVQGDVQSGRDGACMTE